MASAHDRLIVFTGGPGSGKTTLVDALGAAGYGTAPEAGRAVIQDQEAIGGPGLPWLDPALFAELMLCWELRSYRAALAQPDPVFFDHAVPGLPAYFRLCGLPVPAHVAKAAERFRFHRQVFVAPPWREIYTTDTERHQTFAEAVRTYDAVVDTYTGYGYELVELPRTGVDDRVRFVLETLGRPVRPVRHSQPDQPGQPVTSRASAGIADRASATYDGSSSTPTLS